MQQQTGVNTKYATTNRCENYNFKISLALSW